MGIISLGPKINGSNHKSDNLDPKIVSIWSFFFNLKWLTLPYLMDLKFVTINYVSILYMY